MSDRWARLRAFGPPWAWALAPAAAILVVGVVLFFTRFAGEERAYVAATPAPAPSVPEAYTPVELAPGVDLCMAPVALPADGRIMQFHTIENYQQRPGPPMSVRIAGSGGYATSARLPDGFIGQTIQFDVDPPERALGGGKVCLRNDGRRAVQLVGSTEVFTASARPVATLDGTPILPRVALSFYTGERGGVIDRVGDVLDHAAAFKPFGPGLLGLLALLLIVGLPLATVGSLVRSLRRG